jgi:hypothetical protein
VAGASAADRNLLAVDLIRRLSRTRRHFRIRALDLPLLINRTI